LALAVVQNRIKVYQEASKKCSLNNINEANGKVISSISKYQHLVLINLFFNGGKNS
jgi:hypothetical protein